MNRYSKYKNDYQRLHLIVLLIAFYIFTFNIPARAQSGSPPPDPNSAWGQVFDSQGNLLPNVKDGGQVTQNTNWMPNIPLVGSIPATYHVYYTPSGNTVVLPNAVTEFFMAANPQESGLNNAASSYGYGAGYLTSILGAAFGGNNIQVNLNGVPTYVSPNDFAQDMINGQTNIWSMPLGTAWNVLNNLLNSASESDQNLYLLALLYTPDQCGMAPGGCVTQNLPPDTPPIKTPPPPTQCPSPKVIPGAITSGGGKTYPPYPIVVGQDPNKTGVTMQFHASVAPTIYITYQQVPIKSCESGPISGGAYDCGGGTGHLETTGFRCVQRSQSFNECIAGAAGSISLAQSSRDWILGELQLHFPGAYIHKLFFSFGGGGCAWSARGNAQIDDPGFWDIAIAGRTSGTPVSAPRGFGGGGSPFSVALDETVIIK